MGDFLNEMLENAKRLEAMQELDTYDNETVKILHDLLLFSEEPGVNLSDVRQKIHELIEELN